jgi:S-(hydroxymethyl)glutathione dehydrogenase/alcohol dehydrogenase
MATTSRAAILVQPGAPLVIDTIEVADPGPGEVLIRLDAASLCHSDLTYIEGRLRHAVPAIFGHEGIGEVVMAGDGVEGFAAGDVVMPYLVPDCGQCPYCRSGRTNMCAQMGRSYRPDFPTWFRWQGRSVPGFMSLGTFSEYLVVPHDQLQKVNPAAHRAQASCIGCGISTGLGSALIAAKVEAGSSVVVFGMGGVGLSTVQGARIAGASTIVAVDIVADKEAIARRMGATHFVNSAEQDPVQAVRALTGIGADYAFDCVGHPKLFEQGLAALSQGGWAKMISVGIIPDTQPVPIQWSNMLGRNWHNTLMGGAKRQDVARYVDWFVDGKLDLGDMVSHELALDDINEGFDLMRAGKTNRAVVLYR